MREGLSVAEAQGMATDPIFKPFFDMLAVSNRETNAFLKNPNWGQIQANLALAIESVMVEQGNAKAHLDEAVANSARFLN